MWKEPWWPYPIQQVGHQPLKPQHASCHAARCIPVHMAHSLSHHVPVQQLGHQHS